MPFIIAADIRSPAFAKFLHNLQSWIKDDISPLDKLEGDNGCNSERELLSSFHVGKSLLWELSINRAIFP